MTSLIAIVLLPFLGAVVNGILSFSNSKRAVTFTALATTGGSLVIALYTIWRYLTELSPQPIEYVLYKWLEKPLEIQISFLLDPLSAIMLFVVTFVGFFIHLYSTGYMSDDEGYGRYFAYLNLFMGMMLLLILGSNLLVTFIGWEGVGLCSYLLIGFYYKQDEPPRASMKAFVVNRIGDFAFLIAIFISFAHFATLEYREILNAIATNQQLQDTVYIFGLTLPALLALLLFIAATGKSAQLPLYVWLPDAMAGPTPVSALIHAATMVTAGVYLLTRTNLLFQLSPNILKLVTLISVATAFMAASIAIAQRDIKKVLAYSTVSQLGYMFLAAGVGAFVVSIFHLFTHAFFKALLFLGSGSVIHAMEGEQDIYKMGGLKQHLPHTYITFLIGTLAIAGFPPLAGFFSKDAILAYTYDHSKAIYFIGLITAGLTSFYMFRMFILTFHGEFRGTEEQRKHLHESPPSMTLPLWILAIGSAFVGFIGKIPFTHYDLFGKILSPVIVKLEEKAVHHDVLHEVLLITLSVVAALLGLVAAKVLYSQGPTGDERLKSIITAPLYTLLKGKYFVDELYTFVIVTPLRTTANILWRFVDQLIIDGTLHLAAGIVQLISALGSFTTTGNLRNYMLYFVIGIILLIAYTVG